MFGPVISSGPLRLKKLGIWDEVEPGISSTPIQQNVKRDLAQVNKTPKKDGKNKEKDKGNKEERKKLSFNAFGSTTSRYEGGGTRKEDKKFTVGQAKLQDAEKKQRAGAAVDIKEKNFWSRQFSKYCDELEDLMGKTHDPSNNESPEKDNKQCFDALLHGIEPKHLIGRPMAIIQNKYSVLFWNEKSEEEIVGHIRVYSIELMNKSKNVCVDKKKTSPTSKHDSQSNLGRGSEVEKGNITPVQDFQFLSFFNAQAIIKSSKYISTRAVIANKRLPGAIICSYAISANQQYLGVVSINQTNTAISVIIYEVPSLNILVATEPQPENCATVLSFKPFFSYSNSFGSEMDPEFFILPMRETIYYIELTRNPGSSSIHKMHTVKMGINSQMANDLSKVISFVTIPNRDILLGKISETKTIKEYYVWRWNRQQSVGYERLQGVKLEVPARYTLLLDTMTTDLRFMYAFQKGGKDVVRVNLLKSTLKSLFKYTMESKTIVSCLVVDNARYLILGDSANELRIYRKNQRCYQSIYCQYMIENIEDIKLSPDFKHLIVLTLRKLYAIRVHLGQPCSWNFFGKKDKMHVINGVFLGKNKKILRFVDQNYQYFSTYIDDIHGFRLEIYPTSLDASNKHVIQIPNSDQVIIWDSTSVKILSPPIQSCTSMTGGLFRQQHSVSMDEETQSIELFMVQQDDVAIKNVKLNLDNNYVFIHLGDIDSATVRTIEVWNINDRRNPFNISNIEFEYCIIRETELILRWRTSDLTSIEHGYYSNGEFYFEPISVDRRKRIKLIDVKAVFEMGSISKVIFITTRKLFIFDLGSMVILSRNFQMPLEDIKADVSPDGRFIAINERSYRSMLVYGIELNETGDFENHFQLSGNFVETLRFVFTHDSEFLVCLDESFIVKIISLRLKKEISQLNIREYLVDASVNLTHMFFSEHSYQLVLCFQTDRKLNNKDEGFLLLRIPFYSTSFSPLDSILGYYIQRYFYSSSLLEKSALCKNLVSILHSYPHYQATINSVFTAMVLLVNAPNLIEQFSGSFLDFNVLCMHGLLKFSMERNKFFSLISYNNLFATYAARTRETPYIDEEQIETLSRLEKSKMNNRYSRAVLSQVVFSFVRSEYGELKSDNVNVASLPLNYKPHQLEEAISSLMKQDFTVINKYHCYISQIPMDLSTGSEFSIAFFSNISNYSEEDIQSKYKVFIYYKWGKIYYFALAHATLYWLFNIFVYLYMGKYVDLLWMAIVICCLDLFFIMYEIRCFMASVRHYFQDAWNQFDFFNHLVNLAIVISMIAIEDDEKVFILNLLRFFSTSLIGVRGISLLVVFKPTRHITTMFFQVCIQIWPFLIVLAYVIFIATQAWSIEPQIERSEIPDFSFLDALNVVINTSMGNFNTDQGNGQQMTNLQLILIIVVNVVLGLAMLNFLIAFISEIYQKISDKRDYYDVLELLPIIQQFDLLFKRQETLKKIFMPGQVLQITDHDEPHHSINGQDLTHSRSVGPNAAEVKDLEPTRTTTTSQYLRDLVSRPSFIPNLAKKIKQVRSRNNPNRRHYLTIIPEVETFDHLHDLKLSVQQAVRDATQDLVDSQADLILKQDKLSTALRDLGAAVAEVRTMVQTVAGSQESLTKKLQFTDKGKTVSVTTLPDNEDLDKAPTLATSATNVIRIVRDGSDESESLRSDGETDQFLNGNLVNG